MAIKYTKDPYWEAFGKPRNLCSFPSAILFSPSSRGLVNSFQASQFTQRNNRYTNKNKRPKNISSIARLSHEWKARTFLLFTIGIIYLRRKQPLGVFFGRGGGGAWGYYLPTFFLFFGNVFKGFCVLQVSVVCFLSVKEN